MAQYADLAAVKLDLGGDFSPEEETRLLALATALSEQFDARTGRSWGGPAPDPATVAVDAPGVSPVLLLPEPGLRSFASAYVDPAWDGDGWSGGAPVAEVEPIWANARGAYQALRRRDGWAWRGAYGVVLVTGVWDTSLDGEAPPDVVEALTYLTAAFWLRRKESPEGSVGPDGLTAPRRFDPWKDSRVAPVVARHKVTRAVVV